MSSFFLALIAAAAVTLGGREALRVARLSAALGGAVGVLAAGWLACPVAAALAAWMGAVLIPIAGTAVAAAALVLAAIQLAVLRPPRAPVEPTRSFGAIALVLSVAQLVAGIGLPVFAMASTTGPLWPIAAGGALGGGAVLTAAWWAGASWEARLPLRSLRYGIATALLLAAVLTGVFGRGELG